MPRDFTVGRSESDGDDLAAARLSASETFGYAERPSHDI